MRLHQMPDRLAAAKPSALVTSLLLCAGNVCAQFCPRGTTLEPVAKFFGAFGVSLMSSSRFALLVLFAALTSPSANADYFTVPAIYKWGNYGFYGSSVPPFPDTFDTPQEAGQHNCGTFGGFATDGREVPNLDGWFWIFTCVDGSGHFQGGTFVHLTGYCPSIPTFVLDPNQWGDVLVLDNPDFTFANSTGTTFHAGGNQPIGFVDCRVYFFDQFKTPGPSCNRVGNPIDPFTGNKYAYELDFSTTNDSLLVFGRHYNSYSGSPFQDVWTHTLYRKIVSNPYPLSSVEMYRADGARWTFSMSGNSGTPDADINASLQRLVDSGGTVTGYTFVGPNDERETYNASGTMTRFTSRSGRSLSFVYSDVNTPSAIAPIPGLLISVTDDFGRSLQLAYNASSKLSKLTEPDGTLVTYQYDVSNRL